MTRWIAVVLVAGGCAQDPSGGVPLARAQPAAAADVSDAPDAVDTVDVAQPRAATGTSATLVLTIDARGAVYDAGVAVTDDAVDARLRAAVRADASTQLVIQAAAAVPYATIIGLMDRARSAGLTRISLATAPP